VSQLDRILPAPSFPKKKEVSILPKKDLNPNKVKRGEVDEVFLATARQVVQPKTNKYLAKTQAERDRDLKKAQEIVDKANKKKKK
jgi:hypothetical protein